MWTIRQDQTESLQRGCVRQYESEMVEHLKEFFPDQYSTMGEAKAREMIRYGIQRAAVYGIVGQRDVCLYIDMMAEFGRDFDSDRALRWASTILNDAEEEDPTEKVDRLYSMAIALDDEQYAKELGAAGDEA
jgi:hypothetical protein